MMKDKDYNKLFDKRVKYAKSILGDEHWITYEWDKECPTVMSIECRDLNFKSRCYLEDTLHDFTDNLFELKSYLFELKSYLDRKQAERDKQQIMNKSCEQVDHPQHYKQGTIECIDAMRQQFTKEEVVAFCKLNAFKYLWRSNHKGTHQQDIDKANWYLNQISSTYKGE